jgi:hypothetical protein
MKERDFDDYYKILKRDFTKYIELKIDVFKLEFIKAFSNIYTKIITIWVVLLVALIVFSFMLVGLALYLGQLWGKPYLGFFTVAGIFFLIALIFILLRRVFLTNPIIKTFVETLFENKIDKEQQRKFNK